MAHRGCNDEKFLKAYRLLDMQFADDPDNQSECCPRQPDDGRNDD